MVKAKIGSWFRRLFTLLARILTFISVLGTATHYLPSQFASWPFMPEIVALTPWYVIIAVIALVIALLCHRWLTALLSLVCIFLGLCWQSSFFADMHPLPMEAIEAGFSEHPSKKDTVARVMTANVYKGGADAQSIVTAVKENRVEILALQETTNIFVKQLEHAGIHKYLPYSKVASTDGANGNGLWSLTPLGSPARSDVNSSSSQMPAGTVTFGENREVRFISVHTTSPSPGQWGQWKDSLDELSSLKEHVHTRYVLMGDFNSTCDHAPFREFLGDRFTDAVAYSGRGFAYTWPADKTAVMPFAGIDHIVMDRNIRSGQVKTLSIPGSDHRALIATIWVGE